MKDLKIILLSVVLSTSSCGGSSDNNHSGDKDPTDRSSKDRVGFDNVISNADEKEIFSLVNDHRQNQGLSILKWHNHATKESQTHSKNMAKGSVRFGHSGFKNRINNIKTNDINIKASGENVAQNSNPSRAFRAWLRSYGHRTNIEGNYTHTGIGASVDSNGNWYFTQIFLRK
jgi:uncharacterized protein YkwD